MNATLLLASLALTLFCTGMVWLLQLNHYPLYQAVGEDAFKAYVAEHNRRLLVSIILPSAATFVSTLVLLWQAPARIAPLDAARRRRMSCDHLSRDGSDTRKCAFASATGD